MVEQELGRPPASRPSGTRWSLGGPPNATLAAAMGGEWHLAVRRIRCLRWTWSISHSDCSVSRCGIATSARVAMACAEEVVAEIDWAEPHLQLPRER